MSNPAPTVYLEDIDASYRPKRALADDDDSATPPTKVAKKDTESKQPPPPKRQASINTMFFATSKKTGQGSKQPTGIQKLNAIPFSLATYLDSLTDIEKRLLNLEYEVIGKSWLKLLKDEIRKEYFLALKEFLWQQGVQGPEDTSPSLKIYPPPRDIYTWSNTPLGKVKVVILGQDPYHGRGQAHGLCFSVRKGVRTPPSLQNIYTELKNEFPDFKPPNHGHLQNWANSGVLLLNSVLTVREGSANSHADKGWEKFTDAVIDVVDKYGGANLADAETGEVSGVGRGVVFLAWGSYAGKRVAKLNQVKHLILTSAHPSPRSAEKGFFGNNHFRLANAWLEKRYGPSGVVDWVDLAPREETN